MSNLENKHALYRQQFETGIHQAQTLLRAGRTKEEIQRSVERDLQAAERLLLADKLTIQEFSNGVTAEEWLLANYRHQRGRYDGMMSVLAEDTEN